MSVTLDFKNYRLPESESQKFKKPGPIKIGKKRFYDGPFVQGPIPLNWLQAAMELGPASLSVGIILWYVHGLKKSKPFKIGIHDLAKLINCGWSTAFRGLKKLENRGLISIKRQIGAKHIITIQEIIEPNKLGGALRPGGD